jgi:hypothetical protein
MEGEQEGGREDRGAAGRTGCGSADRRLRGRRPGCDPAAPLTR